ncbi:MAG: DUF1990 family protein [Actinomycetes bacterium]
MARVPTHPSRKTPALLSAEEVDRLRAASFTYAEVGVTLGRSAPAGFAELRVAGRVGAGRADFDRAVDALFGWRMHPRAGVGVRAAEPRIGVDTVAVLRLGLGPASLHAPVRVVYLIEEPRRRGFAYGTLPGHPEAGEEAFVVSRRADNAVVFEVVAFSRPASRLTRLGGPVARIAQRVAARLYLQALRRCVRGQRAGDPARTLGP